MVFPQAVLTHAETDAGLPHSSGEVGTFLSYRRIERESPVPLPLGSLPEPQLPAKRYELDTILGFIQPDKALVELGPHLLE